MKQEKHYKKIEKAVSNRESYAQSTASNQRVKTNETCKTWENA